MNKKIENKVQALVKSMYKSVKKSTEEGIIADLMDSDRIAEISPDDVPKSKSGTLNKTKKKKEESEDECLVEKGENFMKSFVEGFEAISKAYLEKDEFKGSSRKDIKKEIRARADRRKTDKLSDKLTADLENDTKNEHPKRERRLKDREAKKEPTKEQAIPSSKNLEYPMAASEKS